MLARIFHTKSITTCGKLISTVLVSNCDLGGMDTYSPASQSFTRLVLTSFAQCLITIQYEISGPRIFRTDRDEETEKADGATLYLLSFKTAIYCSWFQPARAL